MQAALKELAVFLEENPPREWLTYADVKNLINNPLFADHPHLKKHFEDHNWISLSAEAWAIFQQRQSRLANLAIQLDGDESVKEAIVECGILMGILKLLKFTLVHWMDTANEVNLVERA